MKRILSLALAVLLIASVFAGCGKSERVLYNEKLTKYVDLGKYEGISIDSASEEFKTAYQSVVDSDVESYGLYEKKTKGKVANGDTANIDYEGKKDGVAFEGGTAKGYDLTIGSKSFIDGFEDGLIGVEIGSTVDLNLKFPENYGNEELNGAEVVFTVKVNYVTTKNPLTPDKFYSDMKFASEEEYVKDAEKRTVKNMLLAELQKDSKVKDYPEKDLEYIYEQTKQMYITNYIQPYGYTFESYLSAAGQTEEKFKEEMIKNSIKPMMDSQLLLYAVLDDAKLELTNNDINAEAEKIAKDAGEGVTIDKVKEYYGEYYLEYLVVSEKALQHMYDNAKIK